MIRYDGFVLRPQDDPDQGNVAVGVSVAIRNKSTLALASLFADEAGTLVKTNPLTTNDAGRYSFYAAAGDYIVDVEDGSASMVISLISTDELIEDIAAVDARVDGVESDIADVDTKIDNFISDLAATGGAVSVNFGTVNGIVNATGNDVTNVLNTLVSDTESIKDGTGDIAGVPSLTLTKSTLAFNTLKLLGSEVGRSGISYLIKLFTATEDFGLILAWDSAKSKSLHDGFEVISPEAIVAWDGTTTNISTLLSWTGSGNGAWVLIDVVQNKNKDKTSLIRFRNKLKQMSVDGDKKVRLLLVGDSTTAGSGASGVANYPAGARVFSPPIQVKRSLEFLGFNANAQAVVGNQNVITGYTDWDNRFTNFGGWTLSILNGFYTYVWANGSGTSALRFQPSEAFDTVRVWYASGSGVREFTMQANNAGSPTTVDSGTTAGQMRYFDYTVPAGATYVDIRRVTGTINLLGFEAFVAATPEISVIQMGRSGGRISNMTANTTQWDSLNCAKNMLPDLTVINLAINEWLNDGDLGAYFSNLYSVTNSLRGSDIDVALTTGVPTDPANTLTADQRKYVNVIRLLCLIYDIPLIDTWASFGNWTVANDFYTDYTHPNKYGYADCADLLASICTKR